jgi:hypothetical protein
MNPTDNERILDEKVDALLTARPVTASRGFTSATLARIKRETSGRDWDATLDALLADNPVEASPDFLNRTLNRIQRSEAAETTGDESKGILQFPIPRWLNTLAAVAAVVAIGLVSFFTLNQTARTAAPDAQLVYNAAEQQENVDRSADLMMDELFLLAEDLIEAELFLDESDYDAIAALSAQ